MNLKLYALNKLKVQMKRDLTDYEENLFLEFIDSTSVALNNIVQDRINEFITKEGLDETT